jgi:hypothetical protein
VGARRSRQCVRPECRAHARTSPAGDVRACARERLSETCESAITDPGRGATTAMCVRESVCVCVYC